VRGIVGFNLKHIWLARDESDRGGQIEVHPDGLEQHTLGHYLCNRAKDCPAYRAISDAHRDIGVTG